MTTEIAADAAACGLAVLGGFRSRPEDPLPKGTRTLLLLGPDEPVFWPIFTAAPEYGDGLPDPLDRWSERVIGALAARHGGTALLPSDGPPWLPFYAWALRSGRAWKSPVSLLVHADAGLFVSFRGALALPGLPALPPAADSPCPACAQPCRTACPVGALGPDYDLAACHGYLDTAPGRDCMTQGCAARRACPVGAGRRLSAQSAFHMKAFHP